MDRICRIRHTTMSDTLHTFFLFIHESEEAKNLKCKHTLVQPDIHSSGVSLCAKVCERASLGWSAQRLCSFSNVWQTAHHGGRGLHASLFSWARRGNQLWRLDEKSWYVYTARQNSVLCKKKKKKWRSSTAPAQAQTVSIQPQVPPERETYIIHLETRIWKKKKNATPFCIAQGFCFAAHLVNSASKTK